MPIGIYIDCNGIVREFYGDNQNERLLQKDGYVLIEILNKRSNDEFEVVESYVLYKMVNSIKELL